MKTVVFEDLEGKEIKVEVKDEIFYAIKLLELVKAAMLKGTLKDAKDIERLEYEFLKDYM